MTGTTLVKDPPGLERIQLRPRPGPTRVAILLAVLGSVEVLVPYLRLRASLPGQIADHFGLNGQPNGFLSPPVFVAVSVLEIGAIALPFVVMEWWIARTPSLTLGYRGRLPEVLLILVGAIVALVLPLVDDLVLVNGAGLLPGGAAGLGWISFAIGVSTPAIILGWAFRQGRRALPARTSSDGESTEFPVRLAVGRPIELVCPCCGSQYRLKGVPLLAPHIGVGQFGSLYLRCPRCGERGWNQIVGRWGRPG